MKLISTLNAGKSSDDDTQYRSSPGADLIAFSVFFTLLLACFGHFIFYFNQGALSVGWYLVYSWFGGIFLLFSCFAWSRFKASRLSSNWLVRANATRLLIKFRSFQNYYYPETDNVIIDLPWREIEWIRKTGETSTKPGSDGVVTEFFTYLDIKMNLSEEELNEIELALAEERSRKPLRSELGKLNSELFRARKDGLSNHEIERIKQRIKLEKMINRNKHKSRGKHHDYPVSLVNNAILRVRWNAITPNIKKALTFFSDFTHVETELKIKTDSSNKLQGKDLDDMILDRITKGDMMDAINLVKQNYGYNTVEAKQFVEDFSSKSS